MNTSRKTKSFGWLAQGGLIATLLFVIFLCIAFVGTTPFDDRVRVDLRNVDAEGNVLRQVLLLGTFLYLLVSGQKVVANALRMFTVWHAALLLWLFASVIWSVVPDLAFRRLFLSSMTCLCVLLFWAHFGTARLTKLFAITMAILCVGSLVSGFVIENAIHKVGEPQEIVGSWRGAFPHKNNAGFAAMIGILLALHQGSLDKLRRWYFIAALEFLFLLLTDSKTSLGVFFASLALFWIMRGIVRRSSSGNILVLTASYVLFGLIVFLVAMQDEVAAFFSDATNLTNRVFIWQLVTQVWMQNFWTGVGFGSFWQVDGSVSALIPLLAGEGLAANQGHNGYLDIAVTSGMLGLLLSVVVVLVPFPRVVRSFKAYGPFAALFFTLMVVMVLHNFMESSLLRNFQSTWVVFCIAHICSLSFGKEQVLRGSSLAANPINLTEISK